MTKTAIHHEWEFKLPITSIAANRDGDTVAITLGDGSVRFLPMHDDADQPKMMQLHEGVSLSLQPDSDAHAFLSGGDDGKVFIIDPKLDAPTLLAEHKGKWVDHVASSTAHRAYSVGKTINILDDEGKTVGKPHTAPSSAGGLAFSPNGKRLAVSHYNGVSLFWTNSKESTPTKLEWKGSHLGAIWHPDGKILLTSLQENALHGWRLSDNAEMRMQGYAAKIHSMHFTAKGKYLATSGADQVICWPFFGGGPWNKTPLTLGGTDTRLVTSVAPHPHDEMVAAGYSDGMIILAPLDGRMEVMIHAPGALTNANIIGMVWSPRGDCLFAALENGILLLFTIDSVKRAIVHT